MNTGMRYSFGVDNNRLASNVFIINHTNFLNVTESAISQTLGISSNAVQNYKVVDNKMSFFLDDENITIDDNFLRGNNNALNNFNANGYMFVDLTGVFTKVLSNNFASEDKIDKKIIYLPNIKTFNDFSFAKAFTQSVFVNMVFKNTNTNLYDVGGDLFRKQNNNQSNLYLPDVYQTNPPQRAQYFDNLTGGNVIYTAPPVGVDVVNNINSQLNGSTLEIEIFTAQPTNNKKGYFIFANDLLYSFIDSDQVANTWHVVGDLPLGQTHTIQVIVIDNDFNLSKTSQKFGVAI